MGPITPRVACVRPRVTGDREEEILDATLELLTEVGYDRLTMDAVAKRARASKATLYRRWADKASLVIDAIVRSKGADPVEPDTGDLRSDLLEVFCHRDATDGMTSLVGSVVTAVSNDPEFAAQFRERFMAPKLAATRRIYERAQQRGEIAEDLDLEVIAPALAGIVLHRKFLLGHDADADTVMRIVDHLILPAVLASTHPSLATQDTP